MVHPLQQLSAPHFLWQFHDAATATWLSGRDVVYLCWPIAPSYTSPKCGGRGKFWGVSANEYSCAHHVTWSPNKLWRSTSIFNLCCQAIPNAGGGGTCGASANEYSFVHITWHGAQINFGDLPPYLTLCCQASSSSWDGCCRCPPPSPHSWTRHPSSGSPPLTLGCGRSSRKVRWQLLLTCRWTGSSGCDRSSLKVNRQLRMQQVFPEFEMAAQDAIGLSGEVNWQLRMRQVFPKGEMAALPGR